MFMNKVPARKFAKAKVDVFEDSASSIGSKGGEKRVEGI